MGHYHRYERKEIKTYPHISSTSIDDAKEHMKGLQAAGIKTSVTGDERGSTVVIYVDSKGNPVKLNKEDRKKASAALPKRTKHVYKKGGKVSKKKYAYGGRVAKYKE